MLNNEFPIVTKFQLHDNVGRFAGALFWPRFIFVFATLDISSSTTFSPDDVSGGLPLLPPPDLGRFAQVQSAIGAQVDVVLEDLPSAAEERKSGNTYFFPPANMALCCGISNKSENNCNRSRNSSSSSNCKQFQTQSLPAHSRHYADADGAGEPAVPRRPPLHPGANLAAAAGADAGDRVRALEVSRRKVCTIKCVNASMIFLI